MDEVRYYNSSMTLVEAEQYIQSGLITAARAYVANGYYLRRIRDDKLFEEAGYQNFEDYVRGKYNKDKGWASKCIKVNQQLSEEGNSPILSKQYLEYSTYQLVELAYMSEEQREEVDPGMTVKKLKQIRKPEETEELEKSCDVTTSEPEEKDQAEPEIRHFFDRSKSTGDAYGWIRSEVVKEYLRTGYKGPEREYKIAVYGDEYRAVKGETVTVFYNCSGDDRPAAVRFDVENTRLEREYNFFFGNEVKLESKEPEEEQEDLLQLGFYNPDDEKKVDESYSMADFPRASDRHVNMLAQLFVQENARRLFGNGEFIRITDESIIDMLKLFQAREGSIVIDDDVEAAVCAEIIEFYRSDEDLGICLFKKFSNFARKQIDAYIDQMTEERAEKSQGKGTFNSTPTSCPHREGYSCTVSEENRSVPGDGSNCGSSCCWICRYQGRCELECNASAGRDGEIPKYDAAWATKFWAEQYPKRRNSVLRVCREQKNNSDRAKAVQMFLAPAGYSGQACDGNRFHFSSFTAGIDFHIGKVDFHLKYGRFVQELAALYPDSEEPEPVPEKPEIVTPKHESVSEEPEPVPEPRETVIDGEYVEVPPEQELSARSILEEEKAELHNWVKVYQDEGLEMPPMVERQKIIVAALTTMVEDMEAPEPAKQEQPELPILKNNDQRAAFVDAYETWPLWIETKETGERYYRYDLSDGTSMVVKVYHAMLFDYKATGKKYEDRYSEGYGKHEYYFLKEGKFFRDCETNRSDLIEKLKELQKKK